MDAGIPMESYAVTAHALSGLLETNKLTYDTS